MWLDNKEMEVGTPISLNRKYMFVEYDIPGHISPLYIGVFKTKVITHLSYSSCFDTAATTEL